MGYIGLPTASTFATHGLQVVGVDVNQRVVEVLRNGEVHIYEPGLRTLAQAALRSGNLKISMEPEAADAFIIAVPTPLEEQSAGAAPRAEMQYVISAAESIVPHLRAGNLVVLESTSPPGTTVDLLAPILEGSGLQAGRDFYLAYTPERVLPGKILHELIENARVIGGVDRASAEAGRELYRVFVRNEIHLTDCTTAEMIKLMENTYRDVNIALANEFSRLAVTLGVDAWQAIELANLHPRVEILRPGPGVGGHCISVDPWFLVQADQAQMGLIQSARKVNDEQPGFVLELLAGWLDGICGRRLAALGLTYKADVDDLRESPAIDLVERLVELGAEVSTYEPNILEAAVEGARATESLEEALEGADALLLLVDHESFRKLDPQTAATLMPGRMAIDLRGVWREKDWEGAGYQLKVLGVGGKDG